METVVAVNSIDGRIVPGSSPERRSVDTESTVELSTELVKVVALRRPAPRRSSIYDHIKRAMDVVGALLLLAVFSPLMLIIATAVKLTSRGPVIFVQRRLTCGGQVFSMYKFRTMHVNAERHTGPVWASKDDPRVTRMGRFLRRYRLDELPQLWNVVRGDMSLIGPRPERPELALRLERELPGFSRRLEVKGGITGLAQVSAGYAGCGESYQRKLALDIEYVNNRSLALDLRIAARTVVVMLTGFGAR